MKKYNKYIFASMLLGASAMFTACSDSPSCDGGESNRLFMPMFRLTQNLNDRQVSLRYHHTSFFGCTSKRIYSSC